MNNCKHDDSTYEDPKAVKIIKTLTLRINHLRQQNEELIKTAIEIIKCGPYPDQLRELEQALQSTQEKL